MTLKLILSITLIFTIISIFAQEQKISITVTDITIEQAFRQIEKQSPYSIAFNRTKLDVSRRISLSLKDASLNTAISAVLKNTGFGYQINGNHIVVVENKPLAGNPSKSIPTQRYTISGYMRDSLSTESLIDRKSVV